MYRYDIINSIIQKYNYKSYLEIGVQKKHQNFDRINCEDKKCVDPDGRAGADFEITSDVFFTNNKESSFDIIFIDGLHYSEQVFKDINNSLKCLNQNGTILCHDLLPVNELEQNFPCKSYSWTGDCWKAWIKCRTLFDNLEMYVVDVDHGVGIIRIGKQEKIQINQELNWDFFLKNKHLMNIITKEQFLNGYK